MEVDGAGGRGGWSRELGMEPGMEPGMGMQPEPVLQGWEQDQEEKPSGRRRGGGRERPQGEFSLDIRKKFSTAGAARLWNCSGRGGIPPRGTLEVHPGLSRLDLPLQTAHERRGLGFFFSAPFPYGVQPTLGQIPAWQTAGNRGKTAAAAPGASKGPQQDGRGMQRRERLPGNRSVGDTMSAVPPSFPPAALQFLPHPPLDEAEESPPPSRPKARPFVGW